MGGKPTYAKRKWRAYLAQFFDIIEDAVDLSEPMSLDNPYVNVIEGFNDDEVWIFSAQMPVQGQGIVYASKRTFDKYWREEKCPIKYNNKPVPKCDHERFVEHCKADIDELFIITDV